MGKKLVPQKLHITRDLVIFSVGIAGIIYETLEHTTERPTLLVLFASMVGLPVFLRLDGKDDDKNKRSEDET